MQVPHPQVCISGVWQVKRVSQLASKEIFLAWVSDKKKRSAIQENQVWKILIIGTGIGVMYIFGFNTL